MDHGPKHKLRTLQGFEERHATCSDLEFGAERGEGRDSKTREGAAAGVEVKLQPGQVEAEQGGRGRGVTWWCHPRRFWK